ncbi:glycosyltransferase family 2 protein [Aeromicrobium terrae]|uniref:Glycosyltransferase family 2 protein n=1 Tax=Aeromicrobium terrae TaxID=2498846 RepID=A0A5C8NME8_9ACTN|nr:glycosyltransferase family A protein [Aeromicrobium terrae]TXL62326.1 glycosyltransferase family 2 protein [Aeromicrobium terrae]
MDNVPGYLRDQALHLAKNPLALSAAFLRFDAEVGETHLALIASQGRRDFPQVLAWARDLLASPSDHDLDAERRSTDLQGLAALAWLAAGRATHRAEEAADLYQVLRLLSGSEPLDRTSELLDAQTNVAIGRDEYAASLVSRLNDRWVRWMVRTELLRRRAGHDAVSQDHWLKVFNEIFAERGLTPVELHGDAPEAFNRLHGVTDPSLVVENGPLVTVVMSVFRPDDSLFTALRSLSAQTWRSLEVLVVDDCSGPDYTSLIEQAVATDDRFTLVRMEINGGTYRIRNRALALARGEFIAFQDSDDWSHPDRIRRQMAPMLEDAAVLATTSRAVRVYPELSSVKIGYSPYWVNTSSLVFRRAPVLERLGGFDTTRKAADSEFTSRLVAVFGASSVTSINEPLALIQLTHGSLSRSDFRLGHHDPDRVAYRQAYGLWHEEIQAGRADPWLDPSAPRPFRAPAQILGEDVARTTCDVLVISDWRAGIGRYRGAVEELLALAGSPWRTHFLHAETPRFARRGRHPNDRRVNAAVAAGLLDWDFWGSDVTSRLVLVDDPEILGHAPPAARVRLSAERVVVKAAWPPRAPEGGWLTYDPAYVESAVRSLFHVEATWWPATHEVARELRAEGAIGPMLEPRPWGVAASQRRPYSGRPTSGRPVIGTAGLEVPSKDRPTWSDLVDRLPDDDAFDVRIHDPAGVIERVRGTRAVPPNWLVHAGTVNDMLWSLDAFVSLPPRSWGPARSTIVDDALSVGCLVVADETYRSTWGEAVLYAAAPEVPQVVSDVVNDPRRYLEQQQRGWRHVDESLTAAVYVHQVSDLIDHNG